MTFSDRAINLFRKPINKGVTMMLGIYTIAWGLWVANPWLDTFAASGVYSHMAKLMPVEIVWGTLAVLFGLLTLLGLIEKYRRVVIYGAGASGAFWFMICVLYALGNLASTGALTAIFVATLATYIHINCKLNYLNSQNPFERL